MPKVESLQSSLFACNLNEFEVVHNASLGNSHMSHSFPYFRDKPESENIQYVGDTV